MSSRSTILVLALIFFIALGMLLFRVIPSSSFENTRIVRLYYYSSALDAGPQGEVRCSPEGLVPVERGMLKTGASLSRVISLLLRGELTDEERARGLSSEFPLEGVKLNEVRVEGDTVVLRFEDPLGKTVGGSCRVRVLWAQIEKTAQEFSGIEKVRFEPEELFQP